MPFCLVHVGKNTFILLLFARPGERDPAPVGGGKNHIKPESGSPEGQEERLRHRFPIRWNRLCCFFHLNSKLDSGTDFPSFGTIRAVFPFEQYIRFRNSFPIHWNRSYCLRKLDSGTDFPSVGTI